MVVLNRIYTRTGDDGETGLGDGTRVRKDAVRVEAYGTVDEANAALGVVRLHVDGAVDAVLSRIQNDLFDVGADLCTPDTGVELPYEPLRIIDTQVAWLEEQIDRTNADLPSLRSFVLPFGCPAAVHLHVARTVVRRAERLMVGLSAHEKVTAAAIKYMNRLSDFLFVLSRFENAKAQGDVLWVPGENR